MVALGSTMEDQGSTMEDQGSTMEDTTMMDTIMEDPMADMDPLIADTQTVDQDPTVVHMALDLVDLTVDPRNAEDPSAWPDPVDITLAVAHMDQDQTQGFLPGFWEDLKQKM